MQSKALSCVFVQENFLVGDFEGNTTKIIQSMEAVKYDEQPQLIISPELALCAYPPEDLLLRPSLKQRIDTQLERLFKVSKQLNVYVVVGYPESQDATLYNSAIVIFKGKKIANYRKQCLPNYQVFDEKRYFSEGASASVFTINGISVALSICEDIWFEEPALLAKQAGAQLLVNLNASPFQFGKMQERQAVLAQRSKGLGLGILYAHCVGGQDELVFDGGSMVLDHQGQCIYQAPRFKAGSYQCDLNLQDNALSLQVSLPLSSQRDSGAKELNLPLDLVSQNRMPVLEEARQALVLAVRDYVNKNGFKGVVLGLSGGIDSALTLAIACEALGAERVEAVMMPFKYTSQMSQDDAAQQSQTLGVKYQSIAIEEIFNSFMLSLTNTFKGFSADTTEENLQARIRGVLLMAMSNKKGYLVLTTGNKSEMAVGYSTLYGDMAGGFDVLKDVPKTLVFRLCTYLNEISGTEIIPQRVIDRPPSAELAPDQKDEDSLPPYDILDQILEQYVEQDQSAEAIIAQGFNKEAVYKVLRLVDINEYKRQQAPIGPRITAKAFGKDRRYPITNAWKLGG